MIFSLFSSFLVSVSSLLFLLTTVTSTPTYLSVADLHSFTDSTKPIGQQTRNDEPRTRQAAGLLAAYHFNNRDNGVPQVSTFSPDYMNDCSVILNVTQYDIMNSQSGAVGAYRSALREGTCLSAELEKSKGLDVVMSGIRSSRSITLSFLAKLDDVLLVSGWSTSDALSDSVEHPMFGRTIPADSATR